MIPLKLIRKQSPQQNQKMTQFHILSQLTHILKKHQTPFPPNNPKTSHLLFTGSETSIKPLFSNYEKVTSPLLPDYSRDSAKILTKL